MKQDVYRLGGIALLLISAMVAGGGYYLRSQRQQQEAKVAQEAKTDTSIFVRPHSRSKGPASAKVTVVEFFDPECESCREMHPLVKQVLAPYGDDVRLVLRYMPLHPNSVYAAGALEAAGEQGKFWEMLEVLFHYQPEWGSHHAPRPDLIPGYATQVGLDLNAFNAFLAAGTHKALVAQDQSDGRKLGVNGTPVFFVNGKMLQPLSPEGLKALIEHELKK